MGEKCVLAVHHIQYRRKQLSQSFLSLVGEEDKNKERKIKL
jgi:hypothetical protein